MWVFLMRTKLPYKHKINTLYHMQSPLKFGFTNKRGPTYFPWDRCKLGQPSKGASSLPDSRNERKYVLHYTQGGNSLTIRQTSNKE